MTNNVAVYAKSIQCN